MTLFCIAGFVFGSPVSTSDLRSHGFLGFNHQEDQGGHPPIVQANHTFHFITLG